MSSDLHDESPGIDKSELLKLRCFLSWKRFNLEDLDDKTV